MEEDEKVVLDNEKPVEEEVEEEVVEEKIEPTVEEKLEKAEQIAKDQKKRAEKAEGKLKKIKTETEDPKKEEKVKVEETNLSQEDLYILVEAKVPREDVKEITDYAKLKGITVLEALNSNVIKSILKENEEERATASASNVEDTKRGTGKISGQTLLDNAKKGIYPESDKDLERLIEAEIEDKRDKDIE